MNTLEKSRIVATVALLLGSYGVASAGTLSTSSVWASDSQLVYCTATNQANEARPVRVQWIGEGGNLIKSSNFVQDPGRPAYAAIKGPNQFVSCRFDSLDKPKTAWRANIFVVDHDLGLNIFYSDAR